MPRVPAERENCPPGQVAQVLSHIPRVDDPNVLVSTETRDDAGVYRLTEDLALVQTIDFFPPVVNDPYLYGQIAAANAISDVYAMGGTPKTALNLVGYPDDREDMTWLGRILEGGSEALSSGGCGRDRWALGAGCRDQVPAWP